MRLSIYICKRFFRARHRAPARGAAAAVRPPPCRSSVTAFANETYRSHRHDLPLSPMRLTTLVGASYHSNRCELPLFPARTVRRLRVPYNDILRGKAHFFPRHGNIPCVHTARKEDIDEDIATYFRSIFLRDFGFCLVQHGRPPLNRRT